MTENGRIKIKIYFRTEKTRLIHVITFSAVYQFCVLHVFFVLTFVFRFFADGNGNGNRPLHPQIFNLATRATVTANATCGETANGPEVYCKFGGGSSSSASSQSQQCGVCDARSGDPAKVHGPANAVDNATGTWWQSPSLHNGDEYQYVTVTIDLKQVSDEFLSFNPPLPATWRVVQ